MKVAELKGAELDYWVAKAEGERACIRRVRLVVQHEDGSDADVLADGMQCLRPMFSEQHKPEDEWRGGFHLGYSCKWEIGGKIIDRDRISIRQCTLNPPHGKVIIASMEERGAQSVAGETLPPGAGWWAGSTPLEAAMRCKVASVYGVEVPDEATVQ